MTYDSNSARFQGKRRRRLWPLVAALWTAIGLSPCALAAVGNLDCLHCPAENSSAGHYGHAAGDMHAMHGENAAAGHGTAGHAPGSGDCGDDCLDADESLVDARSVKSSSKDSGEILAIAALAQDPTGLVFAASTGGVDPPPVVPVPRERLHAIHCVYLD